MKMVPFILTNRVSHTGSFGGIDADKGHYADNRDVIEGRNEAFRLFLLESQECTKPTRFSLSRYNSNRKMSHQQSNCAILTQNIL